jgi:hypothetical protein
MMQDFGYISNLKLSYFVWGEGEERGKGGSGFNTGHDCTISDLSVSNGASPSSERT